MVTDEFQDFAYGLCSFPKNIDAEVKYELGEQGQNGVLYFASCVLFQKITTSIQINW
jgi:hypothetical protein